MKKVTVALVIAVVLSGCAAKQKWEADRIVKQEAALLEAAKQGKVDSVGVEKLLADYEAFAAKYPGDTMAAEFLYKAGDFYRYMGKPLRSINLYEQIYNNYPTSAKRPVALFLQGFIFENEVKNLDAAKVKYTDFLKQYPNHQLAKDVSVSLANLGKTPEQLIQEFLARQNIDSLQVTKVK